jgi:glycosyltransferase involved in cell wall biosynthesis
VADPLVSIIIPCYNGADCVADAITSALEQSYPRKEVIVVDDGSRDSSVDVIRSFGDAITWLTVPNSGVAGARNLGFSLSAGDLIQFLDQDDLLHRDKLTRQVPVALAHRPAMVFCDAEVTDRLTGRRKGRWGTGSVPTDDPLVHALRSIVQTSAPLHWRETLERVGGFRVGTPPCEDRDLNLRLAGAGVRFLHMNSVLYVLRRTVDSQSNRDHHACLKMDLVIGGDAYERVLTDGVVTAERRKAFAAFFAGVARRAIRSGCDSLASQALERAVAIDAAGALHAYSPVARSVARLFGYRFTERVASLKRRVFRQGSIA